MNLSSNAVKVFPLAKNRPSDRSARLFYEDNVSNIVRQVTDVAGFIITPNIDDVVSKKYDATDYLKLKTDSESGGLEIYLTKHITFSLGGYHFQIGDDGSDVLLCSSVNPTIAEQKIVCSISVDHENKELKGQDDNGQYTGLTIEAISSSSSSEHDSFSYDEIGNIVYSIPLFKFTIESSGTNESTYSLKSVLFSESSFTRFSKNSVNISITTIDGKRDI